MIRFKNNVFDDYFIDEHTAVITDKNGNVKKYWISHGGYKAVKIDGIEMLVHQVQAHTKYGYKPRICSSSY